eukprot:TRINITY_DN28468_c0_g1_i1.p1 TRINITY_DN28468_c0_g1~~TRINITY_DN28468_c0_g1_i1.p1  ORF type:complete len:222 (+),score=49.87 TRINITY_DN28468_c0_g1_i1:338-1003(+)
MMYTGDTDKATPCNLTNHTYWNLSGDTKSKVYGHSIRMPSLEYLPVDDGCIPTGELRSVKETPFDLTSHTLLTEELLAQTPASNGVAFGFDHCFVVGETGSEIHQTLPLAAEVQERTSGRKMTVFTDQPGVQLYTANFLSEKSADAPFCAHMGICLETQAFPDSPNKPEFPSAILRPGQKYSHHTVHTLSLIHISEPTRLLSISYAVFCLKKKKTYITKSL